MKYALLVSRTLKDGIISGWKNIGDYVQSLAAAQFMPRIDEYYDKTADDTGTDTIKMIMNAWYIWNPEKFPLSPRIIPLPISMHISPICAEKLLSLDSVIQWFKKYMPIGCRDKETELFLKNKGIDSYFSGCLTLTLGNKFKFNGKRKGLIFVDPYIASIKKELSFSDVAKSLLFGILHLKTFSTVLKKMHHYYCIGRLVIVKKILYSAIFLKTYSKLFSLNELAGAQYISHMVKVGEGSSLKTEEDKMTYAEKLIKKYSESELVVTGRIHCALPCLGLETPVVFTVGQALEDGSDKSSAGRFGGLIDFFHVAKIKKMTLSKDFIFPVKNKDLYKNYADELSRKCIEFIGEKAND